MNFMVRDLSQIRVVQIKKPYRKDRAFLPLSGSASSELLA